MSVKKYKLKKDFPAIGGLEKDKKYMEVEFPKAWRHMFEEDLKSLAEPTEKGLDKKIKKNKVKGAEKIESEENENVSSDSEETDVDI
ncbi:hypothetical protein KAR91_31290 [Candidatus Pacearchaeota archaeon]|nr:hypothetical protein [Candidatus Pacearchaeota archaeon]